MPGKKRPIILPLIDLCLTVFLFYLSFIFALSFVSIHALHCILPDGHLPYRLLYRRRGRFAETLVYPKDTEHYLLFMRLLCVMFSIRSLSISSFNLLFGFCQRA